jgi:regulatory protein
MSSFGRPISEREPLSGSKLKQRALDLLSRRDHSEYELSRKLKEKGGVVSEIPGLILQLRQWGYLDDARFAENFVRFRAGKAWGQKRYRQELMTRGVSSEVAETVLSSLPELSSEAVKTKLQALVGRELSRGKESQKILASLVRKGFGHAQVLEALESLDGP